jgi:hypothetical protein
MCCIESLRQSKEIKVIENALKELDFKSKLSKYSILVKMVRYFLSDYSSCYGNDETIRLLSTHLDIDMEEAEQLLKAFEELEIQ